LHVQALVKVARVTETHSGSLTKPPPVRPNLPERVFCQRGTLGMHACMRTLMHADMGAQCTNTADDSISTLTIGRTTLQRQHPGSTDLVSVCLCGVTCTRVDTPDQSLSNRRNAETIQ